MLLLFYTLTLVVLISTELETRSETKTRWSAMPGSLRVIFLVILSFYYVSKRLSFDCLEIMGFRLHRFSLCV